MSNKASRFLDTTVILPVLDVKKTVQFYKEKLGFEINIMWENPNYASVRRENVHIEFGEARQKHAGSGVCYIHVEDVDSVHRQLEHSGVEFVGDFSDRDYGCKDFRIKDNNGNLLIIGSPLPNKKELIAKRNLA